MGLHSGASYMLRGMSVHLHTHTHTHTHTKNRDRKIVTKTETHIGRETDIIDKIQNNVIHIL